MAVLQSAPMRWDDKLVQYEEQQSFKLALGQPWVWSVSDFIFLASAYEGGWPIPCSASSSYRNIWNEWMKICCARHQFLTTQPWHNCSLFLRTDKSSFVGTMSRNFFLPGLHNKYLFALLHMVDPSVQASTDQHVNLWYDHPRPLSATMV